jgi:WD40 repeat protein
VIIGHVETGLPLYTLAKHRARILGLAFSNDGRLLMSSSKGCVAKIWEAPTQETVPP